MKSSKVSTRYAQALLDLAIEQNALEAVAGDMKYMQEVCESSRDFELMLLSPIVKPDKKISILKAVFEQFEPMTMQFIELIAKNSRESILPQIAQAFDEILKSHKGIVPITIISATPLDEKVRASILKKIEMHTKSTLEVTETVDASLIGGFIVKMGDQQIDTSISTQLSDLKQRLTL